MVNSKINFLFKTPELEEKYSNWKNYLEKFNLGKSQSDVEITVHFDSDIPVIIDSEKRKFSVDFLNDPRNYFKPKQSLLKEPLARALGSGKFGLNLLDLSAGLGVDSVFLHQLGFEVTAVERNPFIYMALKIASDEFNKTADRVIQIVHSEALTYLQNLKNKFDVAYFDPMFPDKKKSALPKQEMVFFKKLVGHDEDAEQVVRYAVESKLFKRFVVKRPVGAEAFIKPSGSIEGKIIRYDIYGN